MLYNIGLLSALDHYLHLHPPVALNDCTYQTPNGVVTYTPLPAPEALRRYRLSAWVQNRCFTRNATEANALLHYEHTLVQHIRRCSVCGPYVYYRLAGQPLRQAPLLPEAPTTAAYMIRNGWTLTEIPGEGWLVHSPQGAQWHCTLQTCDCQQPMCNHRLLAVAVHAQLLRSRGSDGNPV